MVFDKNLKFFHLFILAKSEKKICLTIFYKKKKQTFLYYEKQKVNKVQK